jgi:hypothetical protein
MQPITLAEMQQIRLMDRVDAKFVASSSALPQLLTEMSPYFKVQQTDGQRIAPYFTQYLDTPSFNMFVMHQNGKLNRQKIRIRTYVDSHLSFLEVKNKTQKGRTQKVRVPVATPQVISIEELHASRTFLEQHSLFDSATLAPALTNRFHRITFVNLRHTERVTIDLNLSFTNIATSNRIALDNIMILELKQDGRRHSDFRDILHRLRIHRMAFSKYCMGMALTDPNIKYNRFKSKCIIINKLSK